MSKILILLLILSVVLLNIIFVTQDDSLLALYYAVWVLLLGGLCVKQHTRIESFLAGLPLPGAIKFIGLGLLMVFVEEVIAGFSMHIMDAATLGEVYIGIVQFLAFNFLALPGFVIGWYVLLSRFMYTQKEVLVLAGLFGLFAEKIYVHLVTIPVMGLLLVLPTMGTYALIIAPSVMSYRGSEGRVLARPVRYTLGILVPILISIPFILVLTYLKIQYPQAFPPEGFTA